MIHELSSRGLISLNLEGQVNVTINKDGEYYITRDIEKINQVLKMSIMGSWELYSRTILERVMDTLARS